MNEIIFILGGARSGKSSYALELAKRVRGKVAFIATCLPLDQEMKDRINKHREIRPAHWHTIEETYNLERTVAKIGRQFNCMVIDCLTLWVSNLMLNKKSTNEIERKTFALMQAARKTGCKIILVANEVGLGIVPRNSLARKFRDCAGKVNQIVAKESNRVYFLTAGLPLKIKGK
jgi:adenosylcobinamide kinase / adenosylcobinamide-phosphate guanylyltransferase